MKFLDLDALDPGYDEQFKPMIGWEGKGKSRKKVVFESKRRVHLENYRHNGPGISVDRLKDWRRLERRAHELRTKVKEVQSQMMKLVRPHLHRGFELFAMGDDDMLVRFSDNGSYSITTHRYVLDALGRDPDFFGKFVSLRAEDGGAEVCKLIQKLERLWNAFYKFQSAWRRGVQDRIQALHTREKWWEKVYNECRTFLIENDGRYHVLTWSHGKCGWVDGELYTTFKGETHV